MTKLLNTKGGRYTKADADRIAAELQIADPEWIYSVAKAPENCGLYCVEAHEKDGEFIGLFGQ
jgi:hypothetical protein